MKRALEPPGIWAKLDRLRTDGSSLVSTTGTVNEVAVTVRTRDQFVGVVWDAVAVQFPELEIVDAPEFRGVSEHAMIGVLTRSQQPTAALQFARYLTARDRGMEVLRSFAFAPVPDADAWEVTPHIHLSAGAMLMPAVADLLKRFEQREGVKIKTSQDGCGVLVAQMRAIKSGQRPDNFPDAYFACDTPFLDDVQQWFGSGVRISENDVVFLVPKGNPKNIQASLAELTRTDLRIGLAHKEKSALGKLTETLLRREGLYEQVFKEGWQEHIVETNAAHDLVNKMLVVKDSGTLDLAVVYRSNFLSTPANRERLDILELHLKGARAVQPFAIASESRHKYLLRRLQQAIVTDASAAHFRDLGFKWIYQP
jgi:ABC-type molybdate transport system substrate-binding protein